MADVIQNVKISSDVFLGEKAKSVNGCVESSLSL